jgi:hypothetical protein
MDFHNSPIDRIHKIADENIIQKCPPIEKIAQIIYKINENIKDHLVFHRTLTASPHWIPVQKYALTKTIAGNRFDNIFYKYSIVDTADKIQGTAVEYSITPSETKINRVENYKDGKLDGIVVEFYNSQKIKEIKFYSGGVQCNIEYMYHTIGSIWIISTIDNGDRHGLQYNYDLDGKNTEITEWDHGKVVRRWTPK